VRKRKAKTATGKPVNERLRQLAWACFIALALHLSSILVPVDQALRIYQYPLAKVPASGEIVFVGAQGDLTDPNTPANRVKLARLISELDRAGAKQIYVDLIFNNSSDPQSDAALRAALLETRGRAALVEQVTTGLDGRNELSASIPAVAEGVERVGTNIWTDFLFGIVWQSYPVKYSLDNQVGTRESATVSLPADMASKLSGKQIAEGKPFPISYFFDLSTIPTFQFEKLLDNPEAIASLAGKKVVIGAVNPVEMTKPNLPGLPGVSPSIVNIYAAETLVSGDTSELGGVWVLAMIAGCLLLVLLLPWRRLRYSGYASLCLSLPLALIVTAHMAVRISTTGAMLMLLVYAAFRARAVWKRGFRLIDEDTNLPTFAAMEADKDIKESVPAIIVAKIHRFDEVRRTLPTEMQAEYVLRIIARLKAATQDATIYIGPGHLIGWTMREKEPALLKEHLEGLRALFASPLLVGTNQVDVGITFGVDITPSPNVPRRLAAAVSAAEHTNETFEPIAIADSASDEDLIWNISLQARIDAALANGEIYLVYQPKVDVKSGALIGVEALVRWNDPEKGHIPPDHFIRQCENAGRMSHLTRHVLREGCLAGLEYMRQIGPTPVAINISATLMHERSIVRMIREVLAETGFDPRLLVLEVTETYRISNLERAAEILTELKGLGAKISMDDFGVGAASLEALMELPFSELKIDRMFIARMTTDAKALGIVTSVLKLGKGLGITVVAEGVEDEQTLNILRDSGCMVAQGFGISRPVSLEEVIKFHRLNPQTARQNGLHFTNRAG